jgi:hypothetical protein
MYHFGIGTFARVQYHTLSPGHHTKSYSWQETYTFIKEKVSTATVVNGDGKYEESKSMYYKHAFRPCFRWEIGSWSSRNGSRPVASESCESQSHELYSPI